jgi:hypothetical protein
MASSNSTELQLETNKAAKQICSNLNCFMYITQLEFLSGIIYILNNEAEMGGKRMRSSHAYKGRHFKGL